MDIVADREGQWVADEAERGVGDVESGLVAFEEVETRGAGFLPVASAGNVHGRAGFPEVQFVFGQARGRFQGMTPGERRLKLCHLTGSSMATSDESVICRAKSSGDFPCLFLCCANPPYLRNSRTIE